MNKLILAITFTLIGASLTMLVGMSIDYIETGNGLHPAAAMGLGIVCVVIGAAALFNEFIAEYIALELPEQQEESMTWPVLPKQ